MRWKIFEADRNLWSTLIDIEHLRNLYCWEMVSTDYSYITSQNITFYPLQHALQLDLIFKDKVTLTG